MDRTEYNRLYARKRRAKRTKEQHEADKAYNRAYYKKNAKKDCARKLERYRTEPLYRLKCNLRKRLNRALKRNTKKGSAIKDLGCSIEDFKKYIESKWLEGMTWENYTYQGWHIDHIKPLSSFNLEEPEEFKKANHYTNLQPLWKKDNLIKGKKY